MIFFKKLLIISLFMLLSVKSFANSYKEPDVPDTIEIFMGKNSVKYYKLLKDALKNQKIGIKPSVKKNINGSVIFKKNNIIKTVEAKIRMLGDFGDHLRDNYSSLKVKLLKGNLGGITRFRLLLPETRNGVDEIFWSILMEELGYLSPYRKMIDVYFNKKFKFKAIFEETPAKEFIERNLNRESPIIEIDERPIFDNLFYLRKNRICNPNPSIFCDIKINFLYDYKIDNSNFIKNKKSFESSMIAISESNLIDNKNKFFMKINNKYAKHGLAKHNRKFLFDPIYQQYHPIYFDGNVERRECKINKYNDVGGLKKNLHIYNNIKFKYYLRTKSYLSSKQKCILAEILHALPKTKYEEKINDFNPKIIENFKFNLIDNKKLLPEIITIDYANFNGKKCIFNLENKKLESCKKLNKNQKYSSISGELSPKKQNKHRLYPILAGYQNYKKQNFIKDIIVDQKSLNLLIPKDFTFFLKLDENVKTLNINLEDKYTSKVVIYKSFLNNLELNVQNYGNDEFEIKKYNKSDQRNLTGCVTIIDSNINNSSFYLKNLKCEDSVNFIRSFGNIKNMEVINAKHDAVDFDYSKVDIENINVTNAGNDCLDFSSGSYNISNANLKQCFDKGFSIGEESYVTANHVKMKLTNVAFAVKDKSVFYLNNLKSDPTSINTCFSVYQKKQEFEPSIMYYNKNNDCDKFNILDTSKIIKVEEKNLCKYIKNFKSFEICLTEKKLLLKVKKIYKSLFLNKEFSFKITNEDVKLNLIERKCDINLNECYFIYNLPNKYEKIYISKYSNNFDLIKTWKLRSILSNES